MNLSQLQTLSTVLQEKSMTAAAQKLFLTQSAVSQQIKQLEDELGIELLIRGVRQVAPTPAGAVLGDYAKRILYLAQQAELAVQTVTAEVKGPLRIGTLSSIGLQLISPIFGLFLRNNKEVSVKLRYGDSRQLQQWLENSDIDIAILPLSPQEKIDMSGSYEERQVAEDEMWLVSANSSEYPDEILSFKELVARPLVWLTNEFQEFENSILKEIKRAGAVARPIFESSNVGTVKRVIEAGAGWGFLPAHSVRKQVRAGRMKRIEVREFSYPVHLMCYFPKTLKSVKVVDVFLKALQGQMSV